MERKVETLGPAIPTRVEINLKTAVVPVDLMSLDSAIAWVMHNQREEWATVVTPNLHLLRQVRDSPSLSRLYSGAALSLPDGWPVAWLASRMSGKPVSRVAGADFFQSVIEQSGEGKPLVLVGGTPGPQLDDLYSRCRRAGWRVSGEAAPRDEVMAPSTRSELVARIAGAGSGGVIVLGIGSPQKEELAEEIAALPGRGAVLCLGMSINFSAGVVDRAPRYVQNLGLEWLYRALSEPRRLLFRYLLDAVALPSLAILNRRRR